MSNIYKISVYDKTWGIGTSGTKTAEIEESTNIHIDRNISQLAKASFEMPRTNSKLNLIDIGKAVKITRKNNDNLEFEGIVTTPLDKADNPVKIELINRGFLFGKYLTPWDYEFDNEQFDNLINNELLYEYRFFRELTNADFSAGSLTNTATLNVASSVTPSEEDIWLILATTGSSPYRFVTNGTFVSQTIDLSTDLALDTINNDIARVRYQARIGQTGDIDVRLRHKHASSVTFSNWSASQSLELEDEMQRLGITSFSIPATHNEVQVGFEMSVVTSYPDATKFSPAIQAFEVVGQYKMLDFALGSIDSDSQGERVTAQFDSHLQILDHVADIWGKQWQISNSGTIHCEGTIGNNLASTVALIDNMNCNVIDYNKKDNELSTVVWGLGHGEGLNRLYDKEENYTNSDSYGKRIQIWETDAYNETDLKNWTTARRNDYDDPTYDITLDVIQIPDIHIEAGDQVRFISDRLDIDETYQIQTEQRWEDKTGERLKLKLSQEIQTFTGNYVKEQEETKTGVNVALKNYDSGDFWTGWISATDTAWHYQNINVGWLGEFSKVEILEVFEDSTYHYETAGADAEIETARYTSSGMVVRYRRVSSGTNRIRLHISWEIWSTRNRQWRSSPQEVRR